MKEIVTIQVGSYANFVGSHFWNFQDELLGLADSPTGDQIFRSHGLNMDVLYRTGETQQGILTYTPRLVSVDFQGSLGSVSTRGTLYNEVPESSVDTLTWTGPVTTHTSQPLKKNLFLQSLYLEETENVGTSRDCGSRNGDFCPEVQDKDIVECLENEVQYWTDFSKVHYHPQSLYELSGLWCDIKDFNNYGIGREAFFGGLHAEEINERLRFFVEECDLPQGIQFIIDDSGGFSGVAGEFLENIADEYTNIPVLLYSVRSPYSSLDSTNRKLTLSRKLHDAVSFSKLSTFSKLIVPMGLPSLRTSRMSKYLCLEDQKPYHNSAVYASAIHSISLPFRMQPLGPSAQLSYTCGAVDVNELVQMLAGQAQQNKVMALDIVMPAPALSDIQCRQSLLENLHPLTPEVAENVEDMHALESMTIHGVFGSGCKRASVSEVKDAVQTAYSTAAERPRFSHLSVAQCPLPIPLPFPSIFGNLVGRHGELLDTPISESASRGSLEVHSIPMAARLRSSSCILPFLENRLENLRKFGIARGALGSELLASWGFGKDDVEDMGETLSNMVRTLNPVSELSSDSD
ncbi:protein misato homolog 1 isoform X1 [Sesamum indicum]|uniref:Protein misato homolog 1 isoform X1 n=1 Tax=Sesamum indicum TaxID=4182 RepID=A0A6I9U5D9_SESIN|nr:protein misato homolog 1 isoform X1 [Sesamum indicum]XP_011092124.1 protein misato homolog 1 isoform X1 [Sesamum indicum]